MSDLQLSSQMDFGAAGEDMAGDLPAKATAAQRTNPISMNLLNEGIPKVVDTTAEHVRMEFEGFLTK
jgi:hypothetical protein